MRVDLVSVYNILHGRVNLPIYEFFETPANPNLCDHRFKLCHQLSHLASRKIAFPIRIVEPWNRLLPKVADSASDEIFKLQLDGVCSITLLGHPIIFVSNLPFRPFVQMPVRGYLARMCLLLDH